MVLPYMEHLAVYITPNTGEKNQFLPFKSTTGTFLPHPHKTAEWFEYIKNFYDVTETASAPEEKWMRFFQVVIKATFEPGVEWQITGLYLFHKLTSASYHYFTA